MLCDPRGAGGDLASTPARAKRLAPRPDGPLTHFASPRGEKCRLEAAGDLNVRDDPRGRLPRARTARHLNEGRPSRNAERSAARSADGSLRKPDLSRSVPRDRNYGSVFMKKHFTSLHSSSNGHGSCVSCLGSLAAYATRVLAWFVTRSAPCPGLPVTGIHQMNFHTASSDAQRIFRMSKKPRRG